MSTRFTDVLISATDETTCRWFALFFFFFSLLFTKTVHLLAVPAYTLNTGTEPQKAFRLDQPTID